MPGPYFWKMTIQQEIGQWGEEQATLFLLDKGLRVVERNWRWKRAEIDIIAKEGKILVFVEVKTRSRIDFRAPEDRITPAKRRLLVDAANEYMRQTGHDWEIRFDIISIIGQPGERYHIKHYPDAFFPGIGFNGR